MTGDRFRLQQVIVNLLDNAIKYSPAGGEIVLNTRAAGGEAIFEVIDGGPGIPAEALPHVFERFFRADSVRTHGVNGTGLGLSIVRSICLAHGGQRRGEQPPGGGLPYYSTRSAGIPGIAALRFGSDPVAHSPESYNDHEPASSGVDFPEKMQTDILNKRNPRLWIRRRNESRRRHLPARNPAPGWKLPCCCW